MEVLYEETGDPQCLVRCPSDDSFDSDGYYKSCSRMTGPTTSKCVGESYSDSTPPPLIRPKSNIHTQGIISPISTHRKRLNNKKKVQPDKSSIPSRLKLQASEDKAEVIGSEMKALQMDLFEHRVEV